jgi:thioredoxin:protein disulfide reductase
VIGRGIYHKGLILNKLFAVARDRLGFTVVKPTRPKRATFQRRQRLWALGLLLLALGVSAGPRAVAAQFLPSEQVFKPSATAAADGVHVHVAIAEGYYLYEARLHVELVDGANALQPVSFPKGLAHHDEYFGDQTIFRQALDMVLKPTHALGANAQLKLTLQGCADAGLCYPPKTHVLALGQAATVTPVSSVNNSDATQSVVATSPTSGTPATVNPPSEQNRLVTLIRTGSLLNLTGAFLLLGVLLSLTPCVLPMVPIMAGLIAGSANTTRRGFALSVCYVLGMCITYTLAGILCALLGAQVQAVFQAPLVIVGFAVVMVLMALSMFGLFNVEMPSAVQSHLAAMSQRLSNGGYLKTTLIGALSALIVSACVAPPLVAALSVIGQTGDVLRGGLALGSLSLGMGVPLLLVGITAGRFIPRSGPWMLTVKAFFGVMLLAVAVWLLEKIIAAHWMFLLWAAVALVASGVFIGIGGRDLKPIRYPLAALSLIAAGVWVVGFYQANTDPWRPWQHRSSQGLTFRSLRSVEELSDILTSSPANPHWVMLDITAAWCVSCKEMDRLVFQNPQIVSALSDVELLRADVTDNTPADQALLKRLQLYGPPGTLFFNPNGAEVNDARLVGFVDADTFLQLIKRLKGSAP